MVGGVFVFILQVMQMASNPAMMSELQNRQDRMLSNLEVSVFLWCHKKDTALFFLYKSKGLLKPALRCQSG